MANWQNGIDYRKNFSIFLEQKKKKNPKKKGNLIEKNTPFSVSDFRNIIRLDITKATKDDLVIKIIGLDLSFVNGIRRILLSETATICLDKIFFYDNSSIINDETLSHRLGLVPLTIAPELIDYFSEKTDDITQKIIFELDVECSASKLKKFSVYSKFLKHKTYGILLSWFKNYKIKPVFKDILIAKLNPGQKIKCESHCSIGIGEVHAKFSPVGTTFYRIIPRIKLIEEILDENAKYYLKKCPVNVFDIEDMFCGLFRRLLVSNPKYCTLCRECLRTKDREKKMIRIGRIRENITFIIESTGILSPENLFHRAICLLTRKCNESLSLLFKNFQNN
nr:DNA-directed RNA polymerase 40k chain [Cryptomonas sp.]